MPESGGTPPTPSGLGPEDAAELEAIGSQEAYVAFLEEARALDASALQECRADIVLAYHNVVQGVENVLSEEAAVGALPGVKVEELRALPRLAQGLAYAALQVHHPLRAVSFRPLFEQALRSRRKLLKAAEALAAVELLPEAEVEALRPTGRQEVVEDCLGLAALLRRHEARIAGRSPVTAEDLEEAEQVATRLRQMLAPWSETPEGSPAPVVEALEVRNRFWTLLQQRHTVLWRCGAWLHGPEVDEHVPPLQARSALARRARAVRAEPSAARTEGAGGSLSLWEGPHPVGVLDLRRVRFFIRIGPSLSKR